MQTIITAIMNQFGYLGIVFLIAVENLFPPIPSEVILTFGGFSTTLPGSTLTAAGVIAAATLGSVLGAVVLYWVGTKLSTEKLEAALERPGVKRLGFKREDVHKTLGVFDRYRSAAVLLGRCVPVVRSLISIPAGMTHMNYPKFMLYTTLGSAAWNVLLVLLGAAVGSNWQMIAHWANTYSKVVGTLFAVMAGVWLYRRWRKTRAAEKAPVGKIRYTAKKPE